VNILDENIPPSQRRLLLNWRVPFRQIGYEIGQKGMQDDDEIIRFLHGLGRPTLFTLDFGFYKRHLCHARYCLVWLDVRQNAAATFVRRLLRHREFNTQAKRMGTVIHVSHTRLSAWRLHSEREIHFGWKGEK
jgi:hypothetical protein